MKYQKEMTLAQKILSRASGNKEVKPGEYVMADIDLVMANDSGLKNIIPILQEALALQSVKQSKTPSATLPARRDTRLAAS